MRKKAKMFGDKWTPGQNMFEYAHDFPSPCEINIISMELKHEWKP